MDKFRKHLLCVLIILFLICVSACGSSSDATETTLSPETTAAPTVKTPAETEAPTTESPETTEAPTGAPTEPITEPETVPTEDDGQDYVLNTNSHKFHYPSCSSVDSMKESNKAFFHGTREEVIAKGYDPCGRCHP